GAGGCGYEWGWRCSPAPQGLHAASPAPATRHAPPRLRRPGRRGEHPGRRRQGRRRPQGRRLHALHRARGRPLQGARRPLPRPGPRLRRRRADPAQAPPLALRGPGAVSGRAADPSGTPLMQQYREIKSRHRDSILFFRMGDFYEMFFDDAEVGARVLNITLTTRGDGVPLAGVPVKAAADYLRQLIAAGHRVAICEQVEDPKLAKGIVRREVIETITPGAVLEENCLPGVRNNFLVAVFASPIAQSPNRPIAESPS